ncbi:MAG: hypothetical protein ABR499_21655 [Gemmatimonadaceae bacterium]
MATARERDAGAGPVRSAVVRGALWAAGLAFPIAALCALTFRFPIPLGGYASGPQAVPLALMAVLFYGALGGFPALLMAGALGGWVAHALAAPDVRLVRRLTLLFGVGTASLGVLTLAVLDKLIGNW